MSNSLPKSEISSDRETLLRMKSELSDMFDALSAQRAVWIEQWGAQRRRRSQERTEVKNSIS